MKRSLKLTLITGALALSASPAMSLATPAPDSTPPSNQGTAHIPGNQGTANIPTNTPGAGASLPAKAKAYGKYCQAESKKHAEGTPGTPFSKCVTAMAKLANGAVDNPRTACRAESKKHVDGQKGTPFSRCVSGGAKLLHDQSGPS